MTNHINVFRFAAILVAILCCTPGGATALYIELDRPGQHEFVRDLAEMISEQDIPKIRQLCESLLGEKAAPIIVVTIESMAHHGADDMRIETFARLLFDQWQIGNAEIDGLSWNTGILLLVSRDDRSARIELGAGWGHDKDLLCSQIMKDQIVTRFRQGQFSGGILAGVEALDKMTRDLKLPRKYKPWYQHLFGLGILGLGVFTVVSLIRRGNGGWAWLMWGAVFGALGYMLYTGLTSSARGGGFSGGSFGGGFSGGGGATGSW